MLFPWLAISGDVCCVRVVIFTFAGTGMSDSCQQVIVSDKWMEGVSAAAQTVLGDALVTNERHDFLGSTVLICTLPPPTLIAYW